MKTNFLEFAKDILIEAFFQTLYMTAVATIFATIIGFIIAITLVITDSNGLRPNKKLNDVLGGIINTIRSFPFIILMVAIIPLTIGAAPFIARVIESSLKEVDKGLIEAAKSFGASDFQIIFKVMIKEAMPSIVSGITLSTISILGYTAMAGAVGAGGLGAVALTYGYQKFDTSVMLYTVLILIVIVQLIQCIGNLAYKKLK